MVLADQIAAVLMNLGLAVKALEKKRPDAIFLDLGGPSGHAIRDRLRRGSVQ